MREREEEGCVKDCLIGQEINLRGGDEKKLCDAFINRCSHPRHARDAAGLEAQEEEAKIRGALELLAPVLFVVVVVVIVGVSLVCRWCVWL